MQKICKIINQTCKICKTICKICQQNRGKKYAKNAKICKKYAKNMHIMPKLFQKIYAKKYANFIDLICAICKKYAENMQNNMAKICKKICCICEGL